MNFSKAKFLKLEKRVQHKKCASLLRKIYEGILDGAETESFYQSYHALSSWMGLSSFFSTNLKEISDHYHMHLKESLVSLKEHNLLPPIRKGDREPKEGFGKTAVYLDRLRSAYNVGSILRTVEALRIGCVYFHEKTPFIDNEKVQKTSQGAYTFVPCFVLESLSLLPRPLIAIETGEEAEPISSFLFPEECTIVIGNEEYGISDDVLKEVDHIVEIPLFGAKNSINVACALAITAQEVRKQLEQLLS